MPRKSLQRRPAPPDLASGRPARRRGVPVRRLARRRPGSRGGRSCRSARRTSTARPTARPPRSRAGPACSPSRTRDVSRGGARELRRAPPVLGRRLGGVRGRARARRPGALRARVDGAARVRAERRREADRRPPDLRRPRERRPRRRSRALPRRRRRGRAARRLERGGQLWGNPLYDWRAMRATGYRWWIERFRRTFELVDAARIDHFRGFVAYWAVPAGRARRRSPALAPRARARPLRRGVGASSARCR